MPKWEGFLILDACVLIDYVDADASVLGTVSRHVAPIAVVRPVFDEVEQLDEALAASLDAQIETPSNPNQVRAPANRALSGRVLPCATATG